MAITHNFNINAHHNIYTGNSNRELKVYFSEPECGVNLETGLLIIIPGFGGSSESNVYKKMRTEFADRHNLVVIQCDYFGSEFMQREKDLSFQLDVDKYKKILNINEIEIDTEEDVLALLDQLSFYDCTVTAYEKLKETAENFNDMGFMQALDLLTALNMVKAILRDNSLEYKENKIIAYGHSHGGYLAHLCNILAPEEFDLIIDNSGWVKPVYFMQDRVLQAKYGKMTLEYRFDYFSRRYHKDLNILNLSVLYKKIKNKSELVVFHGVADSLVDYRDKKQLCESLDNAVFNLIDSSDIDKKVFFSVAHGLGANYLEMFDAVIAKESFSGNTKKHEVHPEVVIESNVIVYKVNFSDGLPFMSLDKI